MFYKPKLHKQGLIYRLPRILFLFLWKVFSSSSEIIISISRGHFNSLYCQATILLKDFLSKGHSLSASQWLICFIRIHPTSQTILVYVVSFTNGLDADKLVVPSCQFLHKAILPHPFRIYDPLNLEIWLHFLKWSVEALAELQSKSMASQPAFAKI